MPVENLRHASELDLIWNFIVAEAESPRYAGEVRNRTDQAVLAKVLRGDRLGMTPEDWAGVRRGMSYRGGYIASAVQLEPEWWTGSLPLHELPDVMLIKMTEFDEIAPSRRLGDFVSAVDGGKYPRNDFKIGWDALRHNFEPTSMRGAFVLLAESTIGPYVEMEGLTRMSCLVSMSRANECVPESVPVLVGISSRLREWFWYPW